MKPLHAIKAAIWLACLAPLGWLAWHVATMDLGPNPVQTLEYFSGRWSLRLLLVTLTLTPLRVISGRVEPVQVRRLLGLWAYTYMTLHFLTYLTFDIEFSPAQLSDDLVKRLFITAGFACWLLLLPLAVTSTNRWQRRLKRRWKLLHRLIYAAAAAAVLHYWWGVKKDETWPLIYLAILAVLLLWRLPWSRSVRAILRGRSATALPSSD